MNAPLSSNPIKIITARSGGINIPSRIKRLLIGAEIIWFDKDPMSQDVTDELHFYFNSNTSTMTDLLLKKSGLVEVSQYVNIKFNWGVEMELVYSMPNRGKTHSDHHYFEFSGTIFPLHEKFRKNRDDFYLLKNLGYLDIPQDHKNKKVYETTKFKCTVIGV